MRQRQKEALYLTTGIVTCRNITDKLCKLSVIEELEKDKLENNTDTPFGFVAEAVFVSADEPVKYLLHDKEAGEFVQLTTPVEIEATFKAHTRFGYRIATTGTIRARKANTCEVNASTVYLFDRDVEPEFFDAFVDGLLEQGYKYTD